MLNLVENGKYTIIMMGEFGFPHSFNTHFVKLEFVIMPNTEM